MKRYMYFEGTEGGMHETEILRKKDLRFLYGWMDDTCKVADMALVEWLAEAEVGDMLRHRLGTIVRLKDKK